MSETYIIAEAGINHNGSLDLALELVEAAKQSGADSVKFQTFKAEDVVSKFAPQCDYQVVNTQKLESQLDMVRRWQLSLADFKKIKDRCLKLGIEFLSTPFDMGSIDLLANDLGVSRLKLPSGEITNAPYLIKSAQSGLPLVVSTGMSTLDEVRHALEAIAFGLVESPKSSKGPSKESFTNAFQSDEGQRLLRERVTLLHCTTDYPAPLKDVNLRAMITMRDHFHLPTGYSDHTQGIVVPIAAVAMGASIIEKHFTLDRKMTGPDHAASLEPNELRDMVKAIRDVDVAMGSTEKRPALSEQKNKAIVRKSLIAIKDIRAGEVFSENNLGVKRPGNGISPFEYWSYLGRVAERNFTEDELIQ
ncbi:MAG: N-acetylneuraminate synthase [Bdellovibrio sp. CG10_big_fil_rev_8_21_14_0_10_47_8]|nr:MAG: N-acetylneuraminate synthase [Bdellovibrio sp. CG10_big_fil_rev_8_21_14_0_10_47_8]